MIEMTNEKGKFERKEDKYWMSQRCRKKEDGKRSIVFSNLIIFWDGSKFKKAKLRFLNYWERLK